MIVRSAFHPWPSAIGVLAAAALAVPSPASAQGSRRPSQARVQPEVRADYIGARTRAAHVGVGLSVPVSTYVRLGGVAGGGQAWTDSTRAFSGRVDALARFVVDPLREARWAPYAAGGFSALYDASDRWRGVLVGALGIEGPSSGGVVPALEIGFGGGTRVGVSLRRTMPGRR